MKKDNFNRKKDRQRDRIQISLKLDPEHDKQVIAILNSRDNKMGFIKDLILKSENMVDDMK